MTNELNFSDISQLVLLVTAKELKKRQWTPELKVKRTDVPAKESRSTRYAQLVRNTKAKKQNALLKFPVPTDTIIAFGDDGKNQIWRRGTNTWTKWEKGRDCGIAYACVKAHSKIYIIGGYRGSQYYSTETDIYDISKEQWSKGPQLNVGRLDFFRQQLNL